MYACVYRPIFMQLFRDIPDTLNLKIQGMKR